MKDDAELYRTELVEKICELDDDLMMMYLDGEEPSVEELKRFSVRLPANARRSRYAAVLLTETRGVQKLLDAVIEFMPFP